MWYGGRSCRGNHMDEREEIKQRRQEKKRKKKIEMRKKRMRILRKHILMSILVWVAATILMCLWFFLNPPYSDETTTQVSGTVTSVEKESRNTGYKGHGQTWIIITLDNGSKYEFTNAMLKDSGLDFETFQNEITGRNVNIRYPLIKKNAVRYLEVEGKTILDYDVFNQGLNGKRVVTIFIYILILIFFGTIIWLNYNIKNSHDYRKNNFEL